jgi:hypothetical protein
VRGASLPGGDDGQPGGHPVDHREAHPIDGTHGDEDVAGGVGLVEPRGRDVSEEPHVRGDLERVRQGAQRRLGGPAADHRQRDSGEPRDERGDRADDLVDARVGRQASHVEEREAGCAEPSTRLVPAPRH